jgi:nucleosome-remodeling factor subunit BPTF
LRQGNLNPEIEEKLLTLQRYQEKQAKGEPFDPEAFEPTYSTRGAGTTRVTTAGSGYDSTIDSEEFDDENSAQSFRGSSRKRGGTGEDDDDEWVLDTPRKYIKKADREKLERGKKEPNYMADVKKQISEDKGMNVIVKTTDSGQIRKNIIFCNRGNLENSGQNSFSVSSGGESEKSPEKALLASKLKMKAAQKVGITEEQVKYHKLQVIPTTNLRTSHPPARLSLQAQLLKHKESLKKIILKKRDTLEKELQTEIQKELSAEMAIHIKNICAKQESIVDKKEPSKYMRKK